MNLQRRNLLAIITGSVISLFGQGASAANGPLVKPKRLGQVIIFRNKKYTAIKKGKLLVWDKGVAIKTAATASPTASATTSTTPNPSATATASALTFVAKTSDITEAQTVVLMVKPASSASFSVAVTKVGSVITVVSAIFIPLTFIAGVYGMNFVFMPELKYPYGYYTIVGVMFIIGLSLLLFFWKRGWLKR